MILPKGVQPWLVCQDLGEVTSYALSVPWFNGKSVEASDGKTLIIIPVIDCEQDVKGPIPIEALKEAFKYSKKGLEYSLILKEEYVQTVTGTQFPRWKAIGIDKETKFPDCSATIERSDKLKRTVKLYIDANRLLAAAKAAGSPNKNGMLGIVLNLHVGKDGIVEEAIDCGIMNYYDEPNKVLVMPMRNK